MGANQLPTGAEMIDIHNAFVVIIVAFLGSVATMIGVGVGIFKWYLPNVFKHRDEARQLEIDGLRDELATKRATEAVDLEKERMLPLAFQSNQLLVAETIKMGQSFNATMQQRTEQEAVTAAAINASTKQLTANTDRLEETTEKLETVEKKLDKLYDRFMIVFPRETYLQELFNELKGVVEETKKACLETKKHKTGELPQITADKATILLTGVEPDDFTGKETDFPKAG